MKNCKTHIIGDIHGCKAELVELVGILTADQSVVHEFVFVGDLVDKGPDSPGVVKFVRELAENNAVVLVIGNHEERHYRYRKTLAEGRPCVMARQEEMSAITAGLSSDDCRFLDSAIAFAKIPQYNVLVVHAGITPVIKEIGEYSKPWAAMSGSEKKPLSQMLRARHVNTISGNMVPMGQETTENPFWADVYDGRFGTVLFGHEAFVDKIAPVRFPHAISLDAGCVYGGELVAMTLSDDAIGDFSVVTTVRAKQKYAHTMGED